MSDVLPDDRRRYIPPTDGPLNEIEQIIVRVLVEALTPMVAAELRETTQEMPGPVGPGRVLSQEKEDADGNADDCSSTR